VPTSCDDKVKILTALSCDVPLIDLYDEFGLESNDPIIARARALNEIGWSVYSEETRGDTRVISVPQKPNQGPIRVQSGSTLTSVQMRLPQIEDDGGSAITSYQV